MTIKALIKENTYVDSVSLMAMSTEANTIPGVEQAIIAMGTDMNKEVMGNVGLAIPEVMAAQASDLIIVAKVADGEKPDEVLAQIEGVLTKKKELKNEQQDLTFATIPVAAENIPDANIAVISVNGDYASREARLALENNLHVMMFSDNVSVADELSLKTLAHDKGLLMMGPDCGTAIINNVGLCFANGVRKGKIGVVGASGTGSQEISAQIHNLGGGISQLIGTGGRDLSEAIGGIMMLDGIAALEEDPQTEVIVIVSKPPAPSVEDKIATKIKKSTKPIVVWFIGGDQEKIEAAGGHFAKMSLEAAEQAVKLAGIDVTTTQESTENASITSQIKAKLQPQQQFVRGLFAGGTLCDEAMYVAIDSGAEVYSNIPKRPEMQLADLEISQANTFIDFGDDYFTQGKPHPMIDPSTRTARFVKEAADPEVAAIMLDFVLGYGSHSDPVGAMLPEIEAAKVQAAADGRHLEIIAYVLGTELDPQILEEQVGKLQAAGVTYLKSNQQASNLLSQLIGGKTNE